MTSAVSRGLALLPTVNVAQVWAAGDHSSESAAHAAPFPSKLRTIGRKSTGTQEPPCAAPLNGVREKGSRPPQEHRQRERENPEAATASSAFQSPTMREMTATIDPAAGRRLSGLLGLLTVRTPCPGLAHLGGPGPAGDGCVIGRPIIAVPAQCHPPTKVRCQGPVAGLAHWPAPHWAAA